MPDEQIITIHDGGRFVVGDALIIKQSHPWYVRFWRWVIRYKPPVYKVVSVDRENDEIGLTEVF